MKSTLKHTLVYSLLAALLASVLALFAIPARAESVVPDDGTFVAENTVLGGTFDEFEAGTVFGNSSAASFQWGTNITYDDPAKVIDLDGNHVLELKQSSGKQRPYSSAFVFISNEFNVGDYMTVEFEYKLEVASMDPYAASALSQYEGRKDYGSTINFSFAPATGADHHIIALDGTDPATTTPGANPATWPVEWSEGANGAGWKKVSLTLEVNPGTLVANSIRWLMPVTPETDPNDRMLIDNVKIIKWIDTTVEDLSPELVDPDAALTFDTKNPADVTVKINTKGETLNTIRRGDANVNATAFTKTQEGEICTVVLSADYLSTLEAGEHTFTANTLEGSVSFTIIVGEGAGEEGGGCRGAAVGSMAGVAAVLLVAGGLCLTLRKKSAKRK